MIFWTLFQRFARSIAHRRGAWTASLADCADGAQVNDAIDEIDEDREERDDREEVSDTIDSGDEAEEVVECANDDRRVVGKASRGVGLLNAGGGQRSKAVRCMHAFCAWNIAVQIEGRLDVKPPTLTAGVLTEVDCGVICGVGRSVCRGTDGKLGYEKPVGLGGGSSVRGTVAVAVGVCSPGGELTGKSFAS